MRNRVSSNIKKYSEIKDKKIVRKIEWEDIEIIKEKN